MRRLWLVAVLATSACGERVVELDPREIDAAIPCLPGDTECSNCVDDDDDGEIDGFDVECTGGADDDEGSFDTAISGDNMDVAKVDCFFDGNSGSGDDGCDLHVCCVLDDCPAGLPGPPFDPLECSPTQECIDECTPLVPPGCDCLGCCTVCDDSGCEDIYLSPALAPDCDADTLHDEVACPRCHLLAGCGTTCTDGGVTCTTSAECADDRFCAAGCCIAVIL